MGPLDPGQPPHIPAAGRPGFATAATQGPGRGAGGLAPRGACAQSPCCRPPEQGSGFLKLELKEDVIWLLSSGRRFPGLTAATRLRTAELVLVFHLSKFCTRCAAHTRVPKIKSRQFSNAAGSGLGSLACRVAPSLLFLPGVSHETGP